MNCDLKMPKHVAIILDGNGRWAKARGLSRSMGHKAGFENLKKVSEYIFSVGVRELSVYAFSTENFKRDKEEVDYLMDLFVTKFKALINMKKDIKIVFSGRKENLRFDVVEAMNTIEEKTKECKTHILNICLNYGGRAEIVDAAKKIAVDYKEGKLDLDDLDESKYKEYLYQNMMDIDLLIRTSGELRVSNFLLYQLSYAEFYFPNVMFPDFDKKEFDKAIEAYNNRDRRFGNVEK